MQHLDLSGKTILITGVAGFIGSALTIKLLTEESNIKIIGVDNINDYYSIELKQWRLHENERAGKIKDNEYSFEKIDISNKAELERVFKQYSPSIVVNLAAQAGVRYSIENPDVYIQSNILGFYNILELCRHSYDDGKLGVEHLVYASSSSVYGANEKVPYSTDDKVDNPVSLYAATKKSNELLAHTYSKLYNIPSTGLRFFTVYGPAGRPDMAYFSFTEKLLKGEKIRLFNYGNCKRDFTYIDDITEGIRRVMQEVPSRRVGADGLPIAPYELYNIGNQNPENLMDFVKILYDELINHELLPEDYDLNEHLELVPMQPGDVAITCADTSKLKDVTGFSPDTNLKDGIKKFVDWYCETQLTRWDGMEC